MISVLKVALLEGRVLVFQYMPGTKLVSLEFFAFAQILRISAKQLALHVGRVMRNNCGSVATLLDSALLLLLLHQNGVGRLSVHDLAALHHLVNSLSNNGRFFLDEHVKWRLEGDFWHAFGLTRASQISF